MRYFGWREFPLVSEPAGYEWVPRIEQLECFPTQEVEVDFLGTDVYLDSDVSVSAMSESETQDASILHKLRMVYPWLKGDHETCQGDSREGSAGEA